jgi:hypothetical protein
MMLISPILSSPTIDKIHLKSFDFKMKTSNILRGSISLDEQGRTEREKYYYNSQTINVTVEPDRQGKDCLKVYFNPDKIEQEEVILECRQVGIDFPILESQVIRADIERHQQLNQSLYSYHSIFHQATSGRTLKTTNNQSFRVGTGSLQIEIYDKSLQAKLIDPNIIRIESRYLKPNYLQKEGIYTLESLLNSDTSKLMQLYSRPKDMYLSNLAKLQGKKTVEQVGDYIRLLEQLHQTSNRPTTDFLQSICLDTIGIEQVLNIIQSADIPKRKRYNAKQYVLKQIPKLSIPQQESRVKEILSYFNLAS